MSHVFIENVSVAYDGHRVVKDISLGIQRGEIGCLLGPSGCGKTTLLRAISGFEPLTTGKISIDGKPMSSPERIVAPEQRPVGMVFQDFALFPHLTVEQNIVFGISDLQSDKRNSRVNELLGLVSLEGYVDSYPHQLSGGQQQRVALVRALAPRPELLLLDEPFSSIDVEFRNELVIEIRRILKTLDITAILVTHDQNEAFAMADRIAVMNDGQLEQWDKSYNLYHKPKTLFVANFIGRGVFLDGVVLDDNRIETELAIIEGKVPEGCEPGCPVNVLIRPDDVIHDDNSALTAIIKDRVFRGSSYLYTLELADGSEVMSLVHSHHKHQIGEPLGIIIDMEHLIVFPGS